MTSLPEALRRLYISQYGVSPAQVQHLAGGASARRYWRLTHPDGTTVVATQATDRAEYASFLSLTAQLRRRGLPVPEVLATDDAAMVYLQQDLSDINLLQRPDLLPEAMRMLARFHTEGNGIEYVDRRDFRRVLRNDCSYFKYCFLKPAGIPYDEVNLDDEMETLTLLAERHPVGLMLRDFQARNILVTEDTTWLIDYQSAMPGPALYDVASLLWQTRLGLDDDTRRTLYARYCEHRGATEQWPDLTLFALLRTLQVLGAYGFRGLTEHKTAFITPIPTALANLRDLTADRYPTLHSIARLALERFTPPPAPQHLVIALRSFGYRKSGIPRTADPHGGGYVFDCRALPNPGRLPHFATLTGRDAEVATWLQQYPEVETFIADTVALVERHAQRFRERGFTQMSAAWGCTGGQHRSVYCAEEAARRLRERGYTVTLEHVEQQ